MTAPAKRRATKPTLSIVPPQGPDLQAIDRVLTETAQQMTPMISRKSVVRERMVTEIKVLEADLDALKARRELVERHYAAITNAFDAEEADINAALQHYRNGLLDGVEAAATEEQQA